MSGSGYAALEDRCREKLGQKPLCEHLDFASMDTRQSEWTAFLENGYLAVPNEEERPSDFTKDDIWFEMLQESVSEQDKENWYACYQLGLQYLYRENTKKALEFFERSRALKENAWALHALAVCHLKCDRKEMAVEAMMQGLKKRPEDLSYVKDGMKLLLQLEQYDKVLEVYEQLPKELRLETRIQLNYIRALAGTGEYRKAMELLNAEGGLEVADTREGDDLFDRLWATLAEHVYGDAGMSIPHRLNFTSLAK